MTCRLRGIAVAGLLGLGATSLMEVGAHAEQGVFDDRILFGQSAAFDGPAAATLETEICGQRLSARRARNCP
jgi:branched-chain amino acid transport system substrate-binding protein